MSKIIAVVNQKGGVGKTTSSVNIAVGLSKVGRSVLAIDLDPQGNLSEYLGYSPNEKPTVSELIYQAVSGIQVAATEDFVRRSDEKVDFIPANKMLAAVVSILGTDKNSQEVLSNILHQTPFCEYDYIVIDCKPSLDLLVTNALAAADEIIIPVQAELFAYQAVSEIMDTAHKIKQSVNPRLRIGGILITMYRSQTNVSNEVRSALIESYGDLVFKTPISFLTEAGKSACEHKSLVNRKGSRIGSEYMQIVKVIAGGE